MIGTIGTIVRETNRKLAEVKERIGENTSEYNYNPCNEIEVKALLGPSFMLQYSNYGIKI